MIFILIHFYRQIIPHVGIIPDYRIIRWRNFDWWSSEYWKVDFIIFNIKNNRQIIFLRTLAWWGYTDWGLALPSFPKNRSFSPDLSGNWTFLLFEWLQLSNQKWIIWRMNLDPFNEKSDDAIWRALDQAHLKAYVTNLASGTLKEKNYIHKRISETDDYNFSRPELWSQRGWRESKCWTTTVGWFHIPFIFYYPFQAFKGFFFQSRYV